MAGLMMGSLGALLASAGSLGGGATHAGSHGASRTPRPSGTTTGAGQHGPAGMLQAMMLMRMTGATRPEIARESTYG